VIVYLHGFRSSPRSFKARLLEERLSELGRAHEWKCPTLPVSPKASIELIERELAGVPASEVSLIGSSLGGYYATYLAERHGYRAVLLNPATDPGRDLSRYLGEQSLWHGGGTIVVEPQHIEEFRTLAVASITRPERYYLIAATGDEVLDYREMLKFYRGATTTLIEGSDHGISNFSDYCNQTLAFCGLV
jgi:uncharacterized protein